MNEGFQIFGSITVVLAGLAFAIVLTFLGITEMRDSKDESLSRVLRLHCVAWATFMFLMAVASVSFAIAGIFKIWTF